MKGFIKVCCITPTLLVGNPKSNVIEMLKSLDDCKASIAVFPELCVTSYTCGDLYFNNQLIKDVNNSIKYFLDNNKFKGLVVIGAPVYFNGALYNTAIAIIENRILGIVPKHYLPNTNEFYEKRWFKSGRNINIKEIDFLGFKVPFGNIIFKDIKNELNIGIEICEDMWAPISPGNILAINGANMILNLSASNETLGKSEVRRCAVIDHSRRNSGAYIYASAGVNESTSETVFSGHNIIASCGKLLKETENFNQNTELIYADIDISEINFKRRTNSSLRDSLNTYIIESKDVYFKLDDNDFEFEEMIDQTPFIPKKNIKESFEKIASLQEYALFKRLKHINTKNIVVGVSGGLDSTLALLVCHQAFLHLGWDPKGIIAVTMPGLATSNRTKKNAIDMINALNVTCMQIDINEAVKEHFKLINHDENLIDLTYENAQARMRTMILMDLATKHKGFVLGTGDMSELALGWCTYNGDQQSMYGINAGIPKTLVRFMIEKYAEFKYDYLKDTLLDIVATPISPELTTQNQKTEDSIGKYELNDFIMYRYLECGDDDEKLEFMVQKAFDVDIDIAKKYVSNFLNRFFSQQFKRQSLPDGPKILNIALSPRTDYRMPSDVKR